MVFDHSPGVRWRQRPEAEDGPAGRNTTVLTCAQKQIFNFCTKEGVSESSVKMDPIIGAWAAASAAAKEAAALATFPYPMSFSTPSWSSSWRIRYLRQPPGYHLTRVIVSIIEVGGVCPFTRSPLAVKDLKPKTDLRAEIQQF